MGCTGGPACSQAPRAAEYPTCCRKRLWSRMTWWEEDLLEKEASAPHEQWRTPLSVPPSASHQTREHSAYQALVPCNWEQRPGHPNPNVSRVTERQSASPKLWVLLQLCEEEEPGPHPHSAEQGPHIERTGHPHKCEGGSGGST